MSTIKEGKYQTFFTKDYTEKITLTLTLFLLLFPIADAEKYLFIVFSLMKSCHKAGYTSIVGYYVHIKKAARIIFFHVIYKTLALLLTICL